jgi:hypothetical protein
MIKVYKTAKKVIVWVGEESHDSALAISCIRNAIVEVGSFNPSPQEVDALNSLDRRTY